ncbi:molybdopterin-binding protein [Methylobacterium durans]|uniref:molybdopterin-binding protein n=1 Tax=Methylobacterium durans TaxID=2202825 RepID=UPI002AFEF962|nr:molybdopterin-binding protein [Methylobacterium durans]MEA1833303.1 molybdopterin-binding protein [Methylobacterium durans]
MKGRTASTALMPLAEALSLLLRGVAPVAATGLPPAEAIGRVAAEDIRTDADRPATRIGLRDGWAVRGAEVVGASPYAPVPLAGPLVWVEAGCTLPAGTDTILTAEAVERSGPLVEIVADAPTGEGTRAPAGDLAAGCCLIAAGTRIGPLQALALAGLQRVPVRLPRVGILLTGPARWGGADARSFVLRHLVGQAAGCVSAVATAPEGRDALAAALAAVDADLTLVVGGTGFGREDHSAAALAQAGNLAVHGIALRPGDGAGFGDAQGRPVLLLPGAPEAMLAAFLALACPLLQALAGEAAAPARTAPLRRKVSSVIGLSEIVFVAEAGDGVEPLGSAELALHRLLLARGAILVPPEREGYPEGTVVEIMPL